MRHKTSIDFRTGQPFRFVAQPVILVAALQHSTHATIDVQFGPSQFGPSRAKTLHSGKKQSQQYSRLIQDFYISWESFSSIVYNFAWSIFEAKPYKDGGLAELAEGLCNDLVAADQEASPLHICAAKP